MKSKCYPVQIVVYCQDCSHHVATLCVEIEKPLSKTTFQQRDTLVREVVTEAFHDGTITPQSLVEHNLGAELLDGRLSS